MLNLRFEDSGIDKGMRKFLLKIEQEKAPAGIRIDDMTKGRFRRQRSDGTWLEYSIPTDHENFINCSVHTFRFIIGKKPIKKMTDEEYKNTVPDANFDFMEELQRL